MELNNHVAFVATLVGGVRASAAETLGGYTHHHPFFSALALGVWAP